MPSMKYKKYSKAIWEAYFEKDTKDFEVFLNNFFKLLKEKKELEFLPYIYKEIEKLIKNEKKSEKTILILKNKNLLKDYKKELKTFSKKFDLDNLEVQENKNIIGGFILKNKKYFIDNSHKNKLLKLYKKIIS